MPSAAPLPTHAHVSNNCLTVAYIDSALTLSINYTQVSMTVRSPLCISIVFGSFRRELPAIYCKVVGEVGPAPGWPQKCTRTAGGELRKLAYWLFSAIALEC